MNENAIRRVNASAEGDGFRRECLPDLAIDEFAVTRSSVEATDFEQQLSSGTEKKRSEGRRRRPDYHGI